MKYVQTGSMSAIDFLRKRRLEDLIEVRRRGVKESLITWRSDCCFDEVCCESLSVCRNQSRSATSYGLENPESFTTHPTESWAMVPMPAMPMPLPTRSPLPLGLERYSSLVNSLFCTSRSRSDSWRVSRMCFSSPTRAFSFSLSFSALRVVDTSMQLNLTIFVL